MRVTKSTKRALPLATVATGLALLAADLPAAARFSHLSAPFVVRSIPSLGQVAYRQMGKESITPRWARDWERRQTSRWRRRPLPVHAGRTSRQHRRPCAAGRPD